LNNINQEYIESYIQELLPEPEPFIKELQSYSEEFHIPIIHPEVAQFIGLLLKAQNCKRVLEIGTAIGYSAILFSKAMGKDSKIITIEREPEMIDIAKQNIKKADLQDNIKILEGEADDILPSLTSHFDCIFLDAAKGHYMDFLPKCLELLKYNGLLISDNVLFRGMVATDHLVKRRKITIVKRMRKYLNYISNHYQLNTSIIPLGDGLAISLKGVEE
jgi:predicted O-methyltransferase YrrM